MKSSMRLALLMVVALAGAAAVSAQPAGGHPLSAERGRCGDQLAQAVGLTDAQKTALATLRQQTMAEIQPIADQARTLHQQIETALAGSSPDRCAIGDLAIAAYGLHARIQTIQKNAEASFVASLSANQQTQYATFIAAHPDCTFFPLHLPGLAGPPPRH